jgi:hypothetical protein
MWARALPHDIVSLSLARNKLHGPLGTATLGAASLEYLDLSTNNLTGPLSEDLGSLTLLRDLRLSGNKLTGSFPRDVTRLQRLRCLSLRGNNLVTHLRMLYYKIDYFNIFCAIVMAVSFVLSLSLSLHQCTSQHRFQFSSRSFPKLFPLEPSITYFQSPK